MERDSTAARESTAVCKFDHEDAAVEVPSARLLISAKKENKMAVEEGGEGGGGLREEVARLKRGRLLDTELILVARLNLSPSGLKQAPVAIRNNY